MTPPPTIFFASEGEFTHSLILTRLGVLLPSILPPCLWQAVKQQVWEFLRVWTIQTIEQCSAASPRLNQQDFLSMGVTYVLLSVWVFTPNTHTRTHTLTLPPLPTASSDQTNPFQIWACSRHTGGEVGLLWAGCSVCVCVYMSYTTVWIPWCKPFSAAWISC